MYNKVPEKKGDGFREYRDGIDSQLNYPVNARKMRAYDFCLIAWNLNHLLLGWFLSKEAAKGGQEYGWLVDAFPFPHVNKLAKVYQNNIAVLACHVAF